MRDHLRSYTILPSGILKAHTLKQTVQALSLVPIKVPAADRQCLANPGTTIESRVADHMNPYRITGKLIHAIRIIEL